MINFDLIGVGSAADTILAPRDIFNALPNKNAYKFQYPRDVQSQVWSKWFERREEQNLIVKMNTGGGKTVVGLLILKSCLNEGKSPAVYICPDNYLVNQVIDAATELGVEVTKDEKSPRFLIGKAILIANIHKVVNGRSVFGVGDEGVKLKVSSYVIDDAHACLDTVEDQFTITIPNNSNAYNELFRIFDDSLINQCESKAIEIKNGDQSNYMQVPYWTWQENISEISKILIKYKSEKYLTFVWPLIKEQLKLSRCVVSASKIEISPHAIPIHMLPSLTNADRKVFMTATLVDDSILSSHFSVAAENIERPIVPESAGDIGDRMILLPQVINPNTTDDEIKQYCKHMSNYISVVVIVPSTYRATYWEDVADQILMTDNLYEGVEKLKNNKKGLTILVNRYDGVDLPGDTCRILVIDGLPDARKQIDKVNQSILMGSHRLLNQTIQRIEQGMGRGVRSNDDYCIVFLMGRDLTNQLYSQGAIDKLSQGTKAQLELSEKVAEQIMGQPISSLHNTINYCLTRDAQWLGASKGVLATLRYSEICRIDHGTLCQRIAYDLASNNNAHAAVQELNKLVCASDTKERGLYKQMLAEYLNLYDKVEAQKTQLSAITDNRRISKPIEGIQYHKISGATLEQAAQCSNYLMSKNQDPNKLLIEIKGIISKLEFKPNSANSFEESMKLIANYIGFQSQRPEQEYSKGPDILWNIGDLKYLVIECKNEAVVTTITKTYCNQLTGSCNWFETKYEENSKYIPLMIHPSKLFEYAASPQKNTRIMTIEKLFKFTSAVDQFITAVASTNQMNNHHMIRDKLIAYKLTSNDFLDLYTDSYQVKNQP